MRDAVAVPRFLIAALALLAAALASTGAQSAEPPADAAEWGVGLGVGFDRKPYRDFDDKPLFGPFISYESRWLSVFGPGIDLKLPPAGPLSFRLRARYAVEGYEAGDSPYLAGMAERKSSFWVGGAAVWRSPMAELSAELLGDASGHSKGRQFRLQIERSVRLASFELTPRLIAGWADRKFVDYYYGVRATEARLGRAQYRGERASTVELGLRAAYAIDRHHILYADLKHVRLGEAIKDSPLIERSGISGVGLGYLYRF